VRSNVFELCCSPYTTTSRSCSHRIFPTSQSSRQHCIPRPNAALARPISLATGGLCSSLRQVLHIPFRVYALWCGYLTTYWILGVASFYYFPHPIYIASHNHAAHALISPASPTASRLLFPLSPSPDGIVFFLAFSIWLLTIFDASLYCTS